MYKTDAELVTTVQEGGREKEWPRDVCARPAVKIEGNIADIQGTEGESDLSEADFDSQ